MPTPPQMHRAHVAEIHDAAHLVIACHLGLRSLDHLLLRATPGSSLDCRGLYHLLSPLEQQLFSAADALSPFSGIQPSPPP